MKALIASGDWAPRSAGISETMAVSGNLAWRNPKISLVERDIPSIEQDELLIKVKYCGICGSDIHAYETDSEGYMIFSGPTRLPCILGHELTGEVIEAGAGTSGFRKGDIITSESILWCGHCTPCRTGMLNQCENVELMGLTSNGGFAEYITLKAKYCWTLNSLRERYSEDETYRIGTLIEPLGCAYNGIFISGGGFLPGAFSIVYGAGPIGLGAIMLLKAAGAAKVIAVDVVEERLALAKAVGADYIFNMRSDESFDSKVKEITDGWGADIQVEAAGAAKSTIPMMQRHIAKRGKMIYLGRADSMAVMDMNRIVSGAHSVIGARGHSGYGIFPNLIKMIQGGRLQGVEKIITSVFPLKDIVKAFESSRSRTDGKILIDIRMA